MYGSHIEKYDLDCEDGATLDDAFLGAEENLNGLENPEKGLFHVYFDGESRVVDGKMEVLLGDGSYYPL